MEIPIVYMVAGISSRFGGKPKGLAKIGPNNETLLEYSFNQAIPAGFSKIILVVGEKTEQLFKEHFGDNYRGTPIEYALQSFNPKERDKPWGTTDALCSAKNLIKGNFIVCNGDDIYGEETFQILVNHLKEKGTDAIVGYKLIDVLPEKGTTNRGIISLNEDGTSKAVIETFNISRENFTSLGFKEDTPCNMNIFALTQSTLNELFSVLSKFKEANKDDRKAECLLPVEINKLLTEKNLKLPVYTTNSKWFGLTNPEDEEIVREQLKN